MPYDDMKGGSLRKAYILLPPSNVLQKRVSEIEKARNRTFAALLCLLPGGNTLL